MGIVLIGYRGSGKTTVGRRLGERLNRAWLDLDELIVAKAGKSTRDIFRDEGEAGFRDREAVTLAEELSKNDRILSLGGGSLQRETNRALLKKSGHRVIYLRCEPVELVRRIQADTQTATSRPALTPLGGGLEEVSSLLAQREPVYRSVMHHEIDVTRLNADAVVEQIFTWLTTDA